MTKTNIVPLENRNELIKVLCVDDSPSILKILKTIFTKEEGFEVVGTALNGLEAEIFLKSNKVDLVTLDIHMPEMDGVSYLRKNYHYGKHPPVIMISSVSRDDVNLAQKALTFGASDFVEKPTLQNMSTAASEIRMKALVSLKRVNEKQSLSSFDKEIARAKKITDLDNKLVIISSTLADRFRVGDILKEIESNAPAVIVLLDDSNISIQETYSQYLAQQFSSKYILNKEVSLNATVKSNNIYFENYSSLFSKLDTIKKNKDILFLLLGSVGVKSWDLINANSAKIHLVVEENKINEKYKLVAKDYIPTTTMPYLVKQYFTRNLK